MKGWFFLNFLALLSPNMELNNTIITIIFVLQMYININKYTLKKVSEEEYYNGKNI